MPVKLTDTLQTCFFSLEGFFYVLFSGSILSAHTTQSQFIHSISGKGRKPVKKIPANATGFLTMKVEVQSPYNRIIISYNREGHRAFAVFLLSVFVGLCHKAVSDIGCRSPPSPFGFLAFQKFRWEVLTVKYAPRKVYIIESGSYVELSYRDFCCRRQANQSYLDKLFIPIQGCLLEVAREQYTDFYRDGRKDSRMIEEALQAFLKVKRDIFPVHEPFFDGFCDFGLCFLGFLVSAFGLIRFFAALGSRKQFIVCI